MAITEYNYIPKYTKLKINNKPKDVVTASYWNGLFNLLSDQGDHTAKELGNILNHFTTVITDTASETTDAIAEEHEYASAFEIHLSTNVNPITADKTFAEIRQAIVDKREILLWVSEVQCLKPTCKAFEHTITLTVFDYSPAGPVVRADVYECYDENEWFIKQNIELAKQNNVGDIRDLTTTHKSDLVAAINEVKQTADTKQDKLIAGENITIAADGKTISAIGGGSTVELDTTLSKVGKAADAKAVGDALAGKQDTISDLATIRSGAVKGATALQAVPNTYRTALAQDIIDSDLSDRIEVIEGKEAGWDAKSDFSGSYNDLTDKPTPLIGTTHELTPTQVYDAVSVGIPVKVQYTHSTYGIISFTAFTVSESLNMLASNMIIYYNGVYILVELVGNVQSGGWGFVTTTLAQKTDIPAALPNPNALTFTGAVTGSYDGSAAKTVNIPSAVTDAHINSLIDTKLGVIENGAY